MSDSIFLTDGNGTITGLVAGRYLAYGDYIIPEYVAGERIVAIGANAFLNYNNMTGITIPDSVVSIGESAFCGCSKLISLAIPNGVTEICREVFSGCTRLTAVDIPDSVISIGFHAFYSCAALTSVTIPDSVASIAGYAFESCGSLTTVYVDDPDNLSAAVSSYNWSSTGSSGVTFVKNPVVKVRNLVINKLTLDQYKTVKSEGLADDEVYVVTDVDEAIDAKIDAAIGTAIGGSY